MAHAQDGESEAEVRSRFTQFVENQLSAENRRIRLSGIQGALSSEAVIGEISIADREGVWLRIVNANIDWNRSALLLGRLTIDRLAAERIDVIRRPVPAEGAPPPEAGGGFALPELPVSVRLGALEVPQVNFGPTVFGLESSISLNGALTLIDGALNTNLDVVRLDGPGGELSLELAYANETQVLDLDLAVSEPADGILANVLGIEGRPAVDLTLAGAGPLGDLSVELALDADGERIVTGVTTLEQTAAGLQIDADVEGPVARLIAPAFRDFFGANSQLQLDALLRDEGGITVKALSLRTGSLDLQASAETTADSFLRRLVLDTTIANADGSPVVLPVAGGETTVRNARLSVNFGETASGAWDGALSIADLVTGTFDAQTVNLALEGTATGIDQPADRSVSFSASGAVDGITARDPAVASALGERLDLDVSGAWAAGEPVELTRAVLSGAALRLALAGAIDAYVFDGTIDLVAQSLSPFADLAGRPLAGSIDLTAGGTVAPLSGGFDLTLSGSGNDLAIGTPAVDALLDSTVQLSGRLARTEAGFEAGDFTIANEQLSLTADGAYASDRADLMLDIALADLALITDQASGRLIITGSARGEGGPVALDLEAAIPTGRLAGRRLADARIGFTGGLIGRGSATGQAYGDGVEGSIEGRAFLDGVGVSLESQLVASATRRALTDLDFSAGGARLTGDVVQDEAGLLAGELSLAAADISTAAALALLDASGAANARIVLAADEGVQNATVTADVANLVVNDIRLAAADLSAEIADLFGVPKIEGRLEARGLSAGGVDVQTLNATAANEGDTTEFAADAVLANGTTVDLAGALEDIPTGLRIALERLQLVQGQTAARLVQPVTVTIEGETITLDRLQLDVAGGSVTASGVAGQTLDLDVVIANLPLSIANTVMPDLAAAGTISGTAAISGNRDAPQVAFDLSGSGLAARPLRDAGLPSVDLQARGTTAGDRVNIDARATTPNGIAVAATGSVPLGDGNLALDVTLDSLPLAAIDDIAGNQGLAGALSATARVGGPIAAPVVDFNATGSNISATAIANLGLAPLQVTANGRFAEQVVSLNAVNIAGPQGLSVDASGTLPLDGAGLNLMVRGNAPLSLANQFVAERGTSIAGTVEFSVGVTGTLADPQINGMVSAANASVTDPESNVQLTGISILASIRDQLVTINTFQAALSFGGSITVGGTISLDAAAAFPADIRIGLNAARYTDGDLIAATASGNLQVSGPLARDPVISGVINVDRAEIGIPEGGGGPAALTDVRHVAPPPGVRATLDRAGQTVSGTPVPSARPSVVRLDITVNAPRRIFIRGRGLDAEVGGSIRVTGPVTEVQPVGAFELIRGRLQILGRRITFDEGSVTLIGDLDPFVNLVARSQSGDTTVIITVSGRASDIDIDFSSQPILPEDEVIAQLIFGRGIGDLSAFQIAQLAAAVAELSGGQNTSLLGQLRQSTGLDDLDVVTDSDGNAAVRAGRYIQDNVYLGVQAGSGGSSEITIDLDITENLKARGAAGADGDTSLGIFYERDY
jgi:translocation and assembly module TamB